MPFIGARSRSGKFQINARVYGPDTNFSQNTNVLLDTKIKELTEEDLSNPQIAPKTVASRLVKLLSFDKNVAWVECEILHESGWSYGDVALAEDN